MARSIIKRIPMVLLVLSIVMAASVGAQDMAMVDNFIIIVDQSSSMFETYTNEKYIKAEIAKSALIQLNQRIPESEQTGAVQVYWPTKTLIGPVKYDREYFDYAFRRLPVMIQTEKQLMPLGAAIRELDQILPSFSGSISVIVVSDGRHQQRTGCGPSRGSHRHQIPKRGL